MGVSQSLHCRSGVSPSFQGVSLQPGDRAGEWEQGMAPIPPLTVTHFLAKTCSLVPGTHSVSGCLVVSVRRGIGTLGREKEREGRWEIMVTIMLEAGTPVMAMLWKKRQNDLECLWPAWAVPLDPVSINKC